MSAYEPSATFHNAAAYLSSASSLAKVSNAIKLELYGLFKYLTVSPTPNTSRPSLFDITGRAKWDAWRAAGETYEHRPSDAEIRYLEIARELGWKEGVEPEEKVANSSSKLGQDNEDDIWDDDDTAQGSRRGRGEGLGNALSTISAEGEQQREAGTVHSFAVSGDAEGLRILLQTHAFKSLNDLDEFGYTPLHLACDRGHVAVIQELLKQHVDQNITDPDGLTALELAQIAEHDDVVALLESNVSH